MIIKKVEGAVIAESDSLRTETVQRVAQVDKDQEEEEENDANAATLSFKSVLYINII